MLYFIKDKSQCTGCGACKNICPLNAIEMIRDEEGFIYPSASDVCTHCGLCERVCPLKFPADLEEIIGCFRVSPQIIKALTRDPAVWMKTSSGGAFYEICRAMPPQTLFVGATMEFPVVRHELVEFSGLDRILGSKYVQSSTHLIFREVKKNISHGRHVVFSGTPCQVAGLLCFLGRRPENLLCVEFICHGYGSPMVFERFISEHERIHAQKIANYKFREKFFDRQPCGYTSKIEYTNGSTMCVEMDDYNKLFLSQLCLRPSCGEQCHYRNKLRNADVTLADLKRETLADEEGAQRNASVVIVNTIAGEAVMARVRLHMLFRPYSLEQLVETNPLFDHTTPSNPKRDAFFHAFRKGSSISRLVQLYIFRPRFVNAIRSFPLKSMQKIMRFFDRG